MIFPANASGLRISRTRMTTKGLRGWVQSGWRAQLSRFYEKERPALHRKLVVTAAGLCLGLLALLNLRNYALYVTAGRIRTLVDRAADCARPRVLYPHFVGKT